MRRWIRRIGIGLLAVLVGVTVAALGYDLATARDSKPATALYTGPFVEVGHTLVAYRSWGRTGSPILLVGGFVEPSWVWHRVGPLLAARGHRVVAVDLPPFGYTERRGPYTMDVGHSLGAGVAVAYALRHPEDVRGIVLLDGDARPAGHGLGSASNLLLWPYYPAAFRVLTRSDWFVGRALRNAWGPARAGPDSGVVEEFERPFRVRGTTGAMKELARHGGPGVSVAELRAVRVPRTVVWGSEDGVDSLAEGRGTARALGVPLVVVPGAGHLGMLTHPGAVAGAILHAKERP